MNYSIRKQEPCADYGKVTLEGNLNIEDKVTFYKNLNNTFSDITNISNGKIIIIKNPDFDFYIYDENRFVMSKLTSIELGNEILNKLFI